MYLPLTWSLQTKEIISEGTYNMGDGDTPSVAEGVGFHMKNQYDRAIRHYNESIALSRDNAHANLNRGIAYTQLGNPHKAISAFKRRVIRGGA